jgi:hypothetical protein
MSLKNELEKFWDWAQITPGEYEKGVAPRNPEVYVGAEWEDEYPNFLELEKEFKEAIRQYNKTNDKVILSSILEAVAIDNESECFIDFCKNKILEIGLFIDNGVAFYLSNTRWQIAELLGNVSVSHREEYLKKMALSDSSSYVRQRALNSLERINSQYLKEACLGNMKNKDETLRKLSVKFLSTAQ